MINLYNRLNLCKFFHGVLVCYLSKLQISKPIIKSCMENNKLSFRRVQVFEISQTIKALQEKASEIYELKIQMCFCNIFPSQIQTLINLKILDISNVAFTHFPNNFSILFPKLEKLLIVIDPIHDFSCQLFFNKLKFIQIISDDLLKPMKGISKLNCLQELELLGHRFDNLQKLQEIGQIKNLTKLVVSFNKFVDSIPNSFRNLSNLKILQLQKNNLKYFPKSITKLRSLTQLRLNNNQIDFIPFCMSQLKELRILDITQNCLTEIPSAILKMPKLKNVLLFGNIISQIYWELVCVSDNLRVYLTKANLDKISKILEELIANQQLWKLLNKK